MTPQVQSIEQIIADQNPIYQSSVDVTNKKKALIPQTYDIQRTALGAQKVQGFNTINDQATSRGMSFSGIPLNEQANYLSTKYLPAVAQTYTDQNAADLTMEEALANIDRERRTSALNTRTAQQGTLEDYLKEERAMAWEKQKFAMQQAADAASKAADTVTPQQYAANFYAQGFDQSRNKTAKGAAESLIGELVANGSTLEEARSIAYTTRKSLYGE